MLEAGTTRGEGRCCRRPVPLVPAGMHMEALVEEGFIGQPLGFNVQLLMPLQQNGHDVYPYCAYPEAHQSVHWLADPASGAGAGATSAPTRCFSCACWAKSSEPLAGRQQVWVRHCPTAPAPGTEDLGCATLALENRAIGNLQTAGACRMPPACASRSGASRTVAPRRPDVR